MRFHLDEHVDHAIAHGLRLRGIDVTTTNDANLLSAPDELHWEFARRESRVIFTNDAGFLSLANNRVDHPGIAYCSRTARSIGYIVRHLCLMHDCLDGHEMVGRIEYL
jgi:predicted nuclease of predicted toxin-antitoxin system